MGIENGGARVTMHDEREIPILGFGTWQIQGEAAYRAVRTALEVGYRHLDTATVYGNEAEVGRAIAESGVDRAEIFLTTKIRPDFRDSPRTTIEASLRALRTDYVDLWLIHWSLRPVSSASLWQAMVAIHGEGRARSIGVSNFDATEIDEIAAAAGYVPAVDQIRWSPFLYDPATVEALRGRAVVLEGYSPLQASSLEHPVIVAIASGHGVTTAQVVLRWHLQRQVVVIPKSVQPARIAENFDLFGFELSDGEMRELDGLGR